VVVGGERGEVVIQHRQGPAGRGLPGCGDELEAQPVEQDPQARRLALGVKVRRQFGRLDQVGDSRGERLLEPLRGALGRVGQGGHDRRLGQEGQVDQGHLAPVRVQREEFGGGGPQVVQRHPAGGQVPYPLVDALPHPPQGRGDQLVLVREVVPDGADRPARFLGDVGQRGPGEPVARDHAAGGIGELAPAGGVVYLFRHSINLALRY
jgi:hypothetical protein